MDSTDAAAAVFCALAMLRADKMQHEQKHEQWATWLACVLMPEWWEI